ncbi:MAG: 2-phosphosulfolactate phosphatase [Chloroflexota bacterium]
MDIYHATLDNCSEATDTVVVIDVLRAFTTAVYAFQAGISNIYPVATVAEAVALKAQNKHALVMGEVGGFPPPEFDFGNSPAAFVGQQLAGKRLIQRTSAGTQGLVRSHQAKRLFAASFACASATVRAIQQHTPQAVALVSTSDHGEDRACADYLAERLRGHSPDPNPFLARLQEAGERRLARARAKGYSATTIAAFEADLRCAMTLDQANFALLVERENGRLRMTPHYPIA